MSVIKACKVVRDQLLSIGLPVYLFSAPQDEQDKIAINYIPVEENQVSSEVTVNVNLMINKLNGFIDSARIESFQSLIKQALQAYNDDTSRLDFCFFRFEVPPTLFSSWNDTNFAYMNNQISVIFKS